MPLVQDGVVAALTVQGIALAFLLRSGRAYVRGDVDGARIAARRSGLPAAGAALIATALIAAGRGGPFPAALAAASGAAALLGGLSGKPRPSGEAATLFWFASVVSLAFARYAP